jgi:hypothetical protein
MVQHLVHSFWRIEHAAAYALRQIWPPQVTHTISLPREEVTAVCCHCDAVVSGTSAGVLRVSSLRDAAPRQSLKLPRAAPVTAICALPGTHSAHHPAASGGAPLACIVAAAFNRVHAYSCEFGVALSSFEAHADIIRAVSAGGCDGTGGGCILYTASDDTTVKAWQVGGAVSPWSGSPFPLLEVSAPGGAVPTCLQARP